MIAGLLSALATMFACQGAPSNDSDLEVRNLIDQVTASYAKAKTLSVTVSEHYVSRTEGNAKDVTYTNIHEMSKPTSAYLDREITGGHPRTVTVTDGTMMWLYQPKQHEYMALPFKIGVLDQSPFENLFLDPATSQLKMQYKVLPSGAHYVGRKILNGFKCDVLEFVVGPAGNNVINRYYFGLDHILRGMTQEIDTAGVLSSRTDMVVLRLVLDQPIKQSRFRFIPGPQDKKVDKFTK